MQQQSHLQTQQPTVQQALDEVVATMEQPSKIFINPKFKNAHINPKFLASNGTLVRPAVEQVLQPPLQAAIHINPAFLEKLRTQQVTTAAAAPSVVITSANSAVQGTYGVTETPSNGIAKAPTYTGTVNPIIKNTRRKLIRATPPTNNGKVAVMANPTNAKPMTSSVNVHLAPLVKIGKNKLVRRGVPVPAIMGTENVKPTALPERKSLRVDHRVSSRTLLEKPSFVKRYALSRIDGINPKKVVVTDPKLLKLKRNVPASKIGKALSSKNSVAYASKNKQLVLVNINGVLYRSSNNKLQKSVPPAVRKPTAASSPFYPRTKAKEHYIIIRGTRYALDRTGMKLHTVGDSSTASRSVEPRMNRIDIGGLTYKARKDGTFIRTDNHKTRSHLSTAKQRSIQVLASKLKKCNEPCHIYRRLGKCLAHARGKCPKVHDPNNVSICQKFLRGECILDGCLLSHNVSLEKMPVCKFFLEGRCVRDVCPYLHKKVSEKERICDAFLNGFCPLADKCTNRHIFQCPEYERFGSCNRARCPYPHGRKEPKKKIVPETTLLQKGPAKVASPKPEAPKAPDVAASLPVRYYREREDGGRDTTTSKVNQPEESGELSASERNQLKRMLGEVDKMKERHAVEDGEEHESDAKRTKLDESVSMNDASDSTSCEAIEDGTVPEDGSDDDGSDEDTRPPVMRRKALGTLPSFIPI